MRILSIHPASGLRLVLFLAGLLLASAFPAVYAAGTLQAQLDQLARKIQTAQQALNNATDAAAKSQSALLAQAQAHPKVLRNPRPSAGFSGFGDNTLNLVLRAYIDNIDDLFTIRSELNQSINDRFKKASIVIAFPQRDVHLDVVKPIEVVLRRNHGEGEPPSACQRHPNRKTEETPWICCKPPSWA
ncbi:mechanosensitive ion channel domain-containing protein [Sulfurivirga caldicuralii]|uniref:mechanosensitive ion channel domain-containing protein n=1 Tax=Sulfurivirga caldicuralii TaxID=364032 RepID=UPI0009416224|nr:mechanosensitive ion channel domain-containing protein [Sulfurivirga caldicuralii]